MTAHGPALIAKAAQALWDAEQDWTSDWQQLDPHAMAARAVLNAVADDLRAGALEEAADELGNSAIVTDELWKFALRKMAAEIRAGAS